MAAKHSEKDQAMASMLRELGVERTSARCPICHATVHLARLYQHVSYTCGASTTIAAPPARSVRAA